MSIAVPAGGSIARRELTRLWKTEDWWAVWLGLGIVLAALVAFWAGGSIKGWAVTPGKWSEPAAVWHDLARHAGGYLTIFLVFGAVFTFSMAVMGARIRQFVPGFVVLFAGSLVIFYLSGWSVAEELNVEAPLMALIVGLVVSNLTRVPAWLRSSLRTEYYIKTGIVLLGATLPLTLIFSAGPIAFLQATLVSVTTWLTIYLAATKIFKLEPQFGAVLGAGGAVCGVSASIAVGGSVRAKKDHISIAIAVVTVWAIVMILSLTVALKHLVPEPISPGVAGAWVGTSEFADAAGFAVVAELASKFGDAPINTFTLMKVIGRDIWIGIWCLILAVVSVVFWEKREASARAVGAGIIWERFPKFVLGFLAASVIVSVVAARVPAGHVGVAAMKGSVQGVPYAADFSGYRAPAALADRFGVDLAAGTISFHGAMTRSEAQLLQDAAATQDQKWALDQLATASDWFASVLQPRVISPIKKLRSWAFVLCFLCIGLSTRFAELTTFGLKPFWAFTLGVLVNVPLGFFLSTVIFVDFWSRV
jgi:uncharacterized membrane protein YadS